MSRYDDYDAYLDARQEAADLRRDALMDEWDEDHGTEECSYDNPECSWVDEEDYDGTRYSWCETHED